MNKMYLFSERLDNLLTKPKEHGIIPSVKENSELTFDEEQTRRYIYQLILERPNEELPLIRNLAVMFQVATEKQLNLFDATI